MRIAFALCVVVFTFPAFAEATVGGFSTAWAELPTTAFSASDHFPTVGMVSAHHAAIPPGAVGEALASAENATWLRDVAVNEIASGWEPARRTALEDLRDAQRTYAKAAGGNRDERDQRFVALLKQVVDNSGRSAARAPSSGGDEALNSVYDRVIRDAPDGELQTIEASENAWVAYRDAFERFVLAMDRPDTAKTVRDDLSRHRAEELLAETGR